MKTLFERVIESSLSELPQICEDHDRTMLQAVADRVESYAIQLLRLSSYLDGRCYWQEDHNRAVKRQNRIAQRVRKALGYSYPQNDISF